MMTLGDIQSDLGIQRVTTYCPTSPQFIDLAWQGIRRLLRRGDWMGTVVPIYVCVYNGCVTWPRYVQAVRKIGFCGQPMNVRNLWYDYMEGVRYTDNSYYGYSGRSTDFSGTWYQSGGSLIQQGKVSVFQDIQGDGRLVRAYARCPQDYGKTVTIFGIDNNGQILQTNNGDGTYSLGVVLVLQAGFVSTPTYVRGITYTLKDQTQCQVDLYAYNASANILEDLAHYEPSETRPTYEQTKLNTHSCCAVGGVSSPVGVMALVKLKFIKPQVPTDLVFINNADAIKFMMQSIKRGEAGDRVGAKEFEEDAIGELNRDIENESPDSQFAVIDNTLGGITFTQQCW